MGLGEGILFKNFSERFLLKMSKRRFKNIDCCKCIALLTVLIYHYWVLSGSPSINISMPGLDTIIPLGGEIGVTMFFVLSGFGIYCLLKNKGAVSWFLFIKSRFIKIAPLYYFSILLVIGLTPAGAGFFSKSGLLDIITHVFFVHNFGGRFHGSINGALWTMGVIFQYYLIAIFLYKCMEKNRYATVLLGIIFTVAVKIFTYKFLLPAFGMSGTVYFVYGRQLVTALDNFVLGMYAGSFIYNNDKKLSFAKGILCLIVMVCLLVLWGKSGQKYGIHTANVSGYLWHSVLAVILAGITVVFGLMKETDHMQILQLIGKIEYGIYLLHFPILQNLLQSPLIQSLNAKGHYLTGCLCFLTVAITVGGVFNRLAGCVSISRN